jgi:hypothetical protein
MPSDLTCLLILPSVVWASLIFIFRSTSKTALKLRTAWNAKTKQELVDVSRTWTLHNFVTFSFAFVGLLLWGYFEGPSSLRQMLNSGHYVRGLFDGVILGLVMAGVTVMLRSHFPKAQRFSLLIMGGVASSPFNRTVMLLLIVLTEELWRAMCLKSLMRGGFTGPQALIATSIAYGLTYGGWGPSVAISECIVGAVLGGLFIWTNSFFVPFAAHLTLLGQILLLTLAVAPDAGPGDFHLRPFRRCPSCNAMLTLRQVNLNPDEAFSCPHCHASITVSDWRGSFFRWGYALYAIPLYVGALDIVDKATRDVTAQFFLAFVLMFLSLIGFWSLLAGISRWRLELESGDSHLIRMNLDKKHRSVQNEDRIDSVNEDDSK